MENILAFLLVFGIIVVVHEFGHFYFAKRAGILVREFAIGFGPKLFHHRKGETTYTIRMLPVGGYVRMAGYEEEADLRPGMAVKVTLDKADKVEKIDIQGTNESVDTVPIEVSSFDLEEEMYLTGRVGTDTEEKTFQVNRDALLVEKDGTILQVAPKDRQFQSASLLQRMLTNFAGPLNNFILAILAFTLLAFVQGGVSSNDSLIGEITEDTPAAESNLETGDRVLSIGGEDVESWNEMVMVIQENPGEELAFQMEDKSGNTYKESIVPMTFEQDGEDIGRIGIAAYMEDSVSAKLSYGFTNTVFIISQIFSLLASFFTGGFSVDQLGGPVAIYATTEAVVQAGAIGLISWLGFLSVNLGIMNLLPIPALDGGKLLLNIIEGIRGKPISQDKEGYITLIGALFLVILMLLVTWNDIQTFFLN
ncbi:MAG: RIP metalloprotease RseP [Alkalibacterium sp.]|uniref:RIP metalloprotease RseP n=1 Tax=Alkalibacterium TaxID=99906 RepID=UPI0015A528B1|nr:MULTISPECIES: RIP metalloprotease RseP [Alkalibacterium]MDN6293087.1 RIP metalloprotease RseP [Alkalibacterium sp.]MDN6294746.1 RIP metalloprotease RseP [Alkalibacterium sp.]MDN6326387.1 RIP metalloprotease RseP [Alkalibacterium sp.]MDN6397648.1 RIP metalloprotease RseP [Alkalibacterium sp.]MDN6728586.1 RIP metalloprotease RseP [Alkalibacterium sp.]